MTPDRIKELMDQLSEARAENERLRDDLFQTVAAFAESGAKNADSVREMIGAVNSIEKSLKEAQAERDALQARVDGALAMLDEQSGNPFGSQYYNEEIEFYEGMRESLQRLLLGKSDRYLRSVEILTGEGE